MKVLVIGSGGREHALCWKISQSPLCEEVLCLPGNAGIAEIARCIELKSSNVDDIVKIAQQEKIDLVVIGPEKELSAGLVNKLKEANILAFGPTLEAAQLESSKSFAKEIMAAANILTASYTSHVDTETALSAVTKRNGVCVIKKDGLAAGKGVTVCRSLKEAEETVRTYLKEAGSKILVEDLLEGEELSVLALCDGTKFISMVAARDYKTIYDDNQGPNTGGMGSYAPFLPGKKKILDMVSESIIAPTLNEMANRGLSFSGVLYAGLMICDEIPYVLEFNTRFGDPETQPLMMLLESDILPILLACADSNLTGEEELTWYSGSTVCIVLASLGYPNSYETGYIIEGLDNSSLYSDTVIFHAGTKLLDGLPVTSGGRVLGITARGEDLNQARNKAYNCSYSINFKNKCCRYDIAL